MEAVKARNAFDAAKAAGHFYADMQKLVGMVCLVIGVLLLVAANTTAHEFGAQMHHVLLGGFPERARFLFIGGTVMCVFGVFQIYVSK